MGVIVFVMVFVWVFCVVTVVRMAVAMGTVLGNGASIIEHLNMAGVDLGPHHLGHFDTEAFTQVDGLQVFGKRCGLLEAAQ